MLLARVFAQTIVGTPGDEFGDTIDDAIGEGGFVQDALIPMAQGLFLALGVHLAQSTMIRRVSQHVSPLAWIVAGALGGAVGGLGLGSVSQSLSAGGVDFNYSLAVEFAKSVLIFGLGPAIAGYFLLRRDTGAGLYLVAVVIGWGIGVGVGTALTIMLVNMEAFGVNVLEEKLPWVVSVFAIASGLCLGLATSFACRFISSRSTSHTRPATV